MSTFMNKLITMGELLIDFTALEVGALADVHSYQKNAGGAPANVAATNARLGGNSILLTKLGADGFGDYLYNTVEEAGVNVKYIKRTKKHLTSLAFVALREDGEREFSFYRHNTSDLKYCPKDVPSSIFDENSIFHFCSVSLIDSPMKKAHEKALKIAKEKGTIISFDPNLRFNLWPDKKSLKKTVNDFIGYADILKLSVDELYFITETYDEEAAITKLFAHDISMIIITKGYAGARLYFKYGHTISVKGYSVKAIDTTGAGDSFIGAFLHKLLSTNVKKNELLSSDIPYEEYLDFANKVAALVCTKLGAIPSLPTLKEVENAPF